jgi:hypothetical protein
MRRRRSLTAVTSVNELPYGNVRSHTHTHTLRERQEKDRDEVEKKRGEH